jgi:hypothetical protein
MARRLSPVGNALAGMVFLGTALAVNTAGAQSVQQTLSQLKSASPSATQFGLRSRGFSLVASDAAGNRSWQYWWNRRDAACVLLATMGDRVDQLAATSESDCNQLGTDPARLSSDGKTAAAAAKLLGVSTLQHKSHQRDASRYNDYKAIANFEQGYRDGLNNAAFSDRERERNNVAYADGFKAGQDKRQVVPTVAAAPTAGPDYQRGFRDGLNKQVQSARDRRNRDYASGYRAGQAKSAAIVASGPDFELGFRDGFNQVAYRDRNRNNQRYAQGYQAGQTERMTPASGLARPGMPPTAALPPPSRPVDLVGRSALEVDSAMKALGYKNIGGLTKGRNSFSNWRGSTDSECVQVNISDGMVKTVIGLPETDCR